MIRTKSSRQLLPVSLRRKDMDNLAHVRRALGVTDQVEAVRQALAIAAKSLPSSSTKNSSRSPSGASPVAPSRADAFHASLGHEVFPVGPLPGTVT